MSGDSLLGLDASSAFLSAFWMQKCSAHEMGMLHEASQIFETNINFQFLFALIDSPSQNFVTLAYSKLADLSKLDTFFSQNCSIVFMLNLHESRQYCEAKTYKSFNLRWHKLGGCGKSIVDCWVGHVVGQVGNWSAQQMVMVSIERRQIICSNTSFQTSNSVKTTYDPRDIPELLCKPFCLHFDQEVPWLRYSSFQIM